MALKQSLLENEYKAVVVSREEMEPEGMTREQYYAPRNGNEGNKVKIVAMVSLLLDLWAQPRLRTHACATVGD